jgi:hypothetical protein
MSTRSSNSAKPNPFQNLIGLPLMNTHPKSAAKPAIESLLIAGIIVNFISAPTGSSI